MEQPIFWDLGEDGLAMSVPRSNAHFHAVIENVAASQGNRAYHEGQTVLVGMPDNGVEISRFEHSVTEHPYVRKQPPEQIARIVADADQWPEFGATYRVHRRFGRRRRQLTVGDFAPCLVMLLTVIDRYIPEDEETTH